MDQFEMEINNLTDADISAWGRSHKVFVYFYTFDQLHISLFLELPAIAPDEGDAVAEAFKKSKEATAICDAILEALDAEQWLPKRSLDKAKSVSYELQLPDFHLAGVAVSLVKATGNVRLVEREVGCHTVRSYGPPEARGLNREVVVEQFKLGQTGLVHHAEKTSFLVDVTSLQMPPLSQLRFVRLAGDVETDMESFELVGAEKFRLTPGAIQLALMAQNS